MSTSNFVAIDEFVHSQYNVRLRPTGTVQQIKLTRISRRLHALNTDVCVRGAHGSKDVRTYGRKLIEHTLYPFILKDTNKVIDIIRDCCLWLLLFLFVLCIEKDSVVVTRRRIASE